LSEQREKILKFGKVLERAGGLAVKVDSAGIAHTWERWSKLLQGTQFDLYTAAVVLVGDEGQFYSCGMHHFGLAECSQAAVAGWLVAKARLGLTCISPCGVG